MYIEPLISFPFIPQQQKRYQQIKSSTLVIQSYIRGWKVSLREVSLVYLGFSCSSQRMMSSRSPCRGELLVSCLPCKQSDRKNKYYGRHGSPCDHVLTASFQLALFSRALFSEQEVLEIILYMISVSSCPCLQGKCSPEGCHAPCCLCTCVSCWTSAPPARSFRNFLVTVLWTAP